MFRNLVLLGVVCCGCVPPAGLDGGTGGGAGGGGGRDAGGAMTLDEFCQGDLAARCEALARCGVVETVAGCEVLLTSPQAFITCDEGRKAVAAGRMTFDPVAARACRTALAGACFSSGDTCNRVFVGATPLGGNCFYNPSSECVAGAVCTFWDSCPGRCIAAGLAGQVVSQGLACADGLFPLPRTDGGTGVVCTPRLQAGQPCGPLAWGGAMAFNDCGAGLACNSASGVCEPLRQAGASCQAEDGGIFPLLVCNSYEGLSCDQAQPGASNTCLPPRALGERCGTCKFDLQCASLQGGGTSCIPRGEAGQYCNGPNGCTGANYCRSTSGFGPGNCAPLLAAGQVCGSSIECAGSLPCQLGPNPDGGIIAVGRCTPVDGGVAGYACRAP